MNINLVILWFPTFIRVVVSSAELVEADWKLHEHMVFLQDFPMLATTTNIECPSDSFGRDLVELLTMLDCPSQVKRAVYNYDYSAAEAVLIASIPGLHTDKNVAEWGLLGLRRLIYNMGLIEQANMVTDFVDHWNSKATFLSTFRKAATAAAKKDNMVVLMNSGL
ncbi:hypothetical protein HDU76_007505 [Blyttiomyces sp. JEL0837]|nr:hypothetical protein HDU76_007505 [Blyttiomyces sp. JEL0837]